MYLDLSENEELIASIRETHEDTFVGLEAVQMVRMSDCNITSRLVRKPQACHPGTDVEIQGLE